MHNQCLPLMLWHVMVFGVRTLDELGPYMPQIIDQLGEFAARREPVYRIHVRGYTVEVS